MTNEQIEKQIQNGVASQERFWSKVNKIEGGCWEWLGNKNDKGYGFFTYERKTRPAHRVAYEWAKGVIPKGLELDHLCRNTSCVNPDHLEPVSHHENVIRGIGACALNSRKTHCKRGHPFKESNIYHRSDGYRECKQCRILFNAARYKRKYPGLAEALKGVAL